MALIVLAEPTVKGRGPKPGFSLFALGFRPFYLVAATFAAIAIPVWVAVLTGALTMPMAGIWWHAHEMLFGFVAAVVVGFLFTAGRNWTGLATPTGVSLAALVGLWLAGRLLIALDGGPLAAIVDSLFLPLAALALARVLWRGHSRRNYFTVVLLMLLTAANVVFHLARLGIAAVDPMAALHGALAVVVTLETVIAGRVVPSFTASALRGVAQWRRPWFDWLAVVATVLALVAWVFSLAPEMVGGMCALAAVLQLIRSLGWNPWATRREPLLWILHLAHLWLPLGLALLAASQWTGVPASAGIHALTIGTTGGLIIGMTTRTALGHTGRMLAVGRTETIAYLLVMIAAGLRVATLVLWPESAMAGVHGAALLWSAAFACYVWKYLPYLWRPRLDGQPG